MHSVWHLIVKLAHLPLPLCRPWDLLCLVLGKVWTDAGDANLADTHDWSRGLQPHSQASNLALWLWIPMAHTLRSSAVAFRTTEMANY